MHIQALPPLAVVGSINVDLTALVRRLPGPGETVGGGTFRRDAGGKGANQAAAGARLGARVRMVGAVGDDPDGAWMLASLEAAGVDVLNVKRVDEPTGSALIAVDADGENQIAVCPGANRKVAPSRVRFDVDEVVLTQLELPLDLVLALTEAVPGFLAVNAAPAQPLPNTLLERVDLFIVNESEFSLMPELREASLVAVTYGARGAALLSHGEEIARAAAVETTVVNTVGAGDAFCSALVLALRSGMNHAQALSTACVVGAAAVADPASQPQLRPLSEYTAQGART